VPRWLSETIQQRATKPQQQAGKHRCRLGILGKLGKRSKPSKLSKPSNSVTKDANDICGGLSFSFSALSVFVPMYWPPEQCPMATDTSEDQSAFLQPSAFLTGLLFCPL